MVHCRWMIYLFANDILCGLGKLIALAFDKGKNMFPRLRLFMSATLNALTLASAATCSVSHVPLKLKPVALRTRMSPWQSFPPSHLSC
ncbi:Glycine betaine reductase ATRR [Trichinella pseudospiralis]